jgi:hypothetical protein
MVLLLASVVDKNAHQLAAECSHARVFTCEDLATQKIALRGADIDGSTITVRGEKISVSKIAGIINLLPFVLRDELFFFPLEEREYQAEEFMALINYFISFINCPVINGPSLINLSGLSFNNIHWYNLAHKLSIPVYTCVLDTQNKLPSNAADDKLIDITYFNGSIISPDGSIGENYTYKLAKEAAVDYLKVSYLKIEMDRIQFVRARTVPDINDNETRKAFVEYINSLNH